MDGDGGSALKSSGVCGTRSGVVSRECASPVVSATELATSTSMVMRCAEGFKIVWPRENKSTPTRFK